MAKTLPAKFDIVNKHAKNFPPELLLHDYIRTVTFDVPKNTITKYINNVYTLGPIQKTGWKRYYKYLYGISVLFISASNATINKNRAKVTLYGWNDRDLTYDHKYMPSEGAPNPIQVKPINNKTP